MIQMEAGEVPTPQKLRYRECKIRIKLLLKTILIEISLAILEELLKIYLSDLSIILCFYLHLYNISNNYINDFIYIYIIFLIII